MLNVLGIILLLTFALMLVIGMICNISSDYYYSATITVGIILLLSGILSFIDKSNPTAIDVYRGKTTLEVTYRNGIAIDSAVVFKERK